MTEFYFPDLFQFFNDSGDVPIFVTYFTILKWSHDMLSRNIFI